MRWIRTWYGEQSRKQQLVMFFALYTLIFLLLWFGTHISMLQAGKSYIELDDSLSVYYEMAMHRRKLVLRFFDMLFSEGKFEIPWINFNLTSDQNLVCLIGNEIFDIFLCLTPKQHLESMYSFIIILRVWCAGVAFSLYCIRMGNPKCYVLLGSIVYCFYGFSLNFAFHQPFFVSMLYLTPFMLIGIEDILSEKKGTILTVSTAIAAINSVYLTYYMTIVLLMYCLYRLLDGEQKIKHQLKMCACIAVYYLWGIVISAAIFVPTVILIIESGRAASGNNLPENIFYGAPHALRIFKYFFIGNSVSLNSTYVGVSIVALYPILYLFIKKKKWDGMGVMLVLLFMNIPLFGYFAGGGNVSNRWSYILGGILAYGVVKNMPILLSEKNRLQIICLNFLAVLYGVILFYVYQRGRETVVLVAVLFISAMIGFMNIIWKLKNWYASYAIIWGIAFISILINGKVLENEVFLKRYADKGQVNNILEQYADVLATEIEDETFYRIDKYGYENEIGCNLPFWYQYYGISSFTNIINPNIVDYFQESENPGLIQLNKLSHLDGRITDETLACVKYYLVKSDQVGSVPHNFTFLKNSEKNKSYKIYVNKNVMPLGFCYASYISISDYQKLDIAKKQEMMLRRIVLDQATESKDILKLDSQVIPFDIVSLQNVKKGQNGYDVKGKNAQIILEFESANLHETYLQLTNVKNYNNGACIVYAENGSIKKSALSHGITEARSNGLENFTFNFGKGSAGRTNLKITFSQSGNFSIGDLKIYTRSLSRYEKDIKKLRENILSDIVFQTNGLEGKINIKQDNFLFLSIPYAKGWSCYVNSEKTKLLKANLMYMAVELKAGEHHIRLKYTPPGILLGCCLSLVGNCCLLVTLLVRKEGHRHGKRNL